MLRPSIPCGQGPLVTELATVYICFMLGFSLTVYELYMGACTLLMCGNCNHNFRLPVVITIYKEVNINIIKINFEHKINVKNSMKKLQGYCVSWLVYFMGAAQLLLVCGQSSPAGMLNSASSAILIMSIAWMQQCTCL